MIYWLIIAGIFGVDMGVKNAVEKCGDLTGEAQKMGRLLMLRRFHNRGMALNLGEKHRKVVASLSVVMTVGLTVLFIVSLGRRGSSLLRTGLAFLLGGAFSNTYDRLRRKYVVDYVSFNLPVKRLRNIVFNIADFSIMIGALLIILSVGGSENR